MKEQREKKAMINKIVYFTLTSAAEAPMGIVIRKAGLPPLFFLSFVFFFFLCPFLLDLLLFDEVAGVQRDITQTQSSMGRANFGSSAETGVSLRRLTGTCVCSGVLSHLAAKKCREKSEIGSAMFISHQIASPTFFCAC